MKRAHICIIYTGGTIGMRKTSRGYRPQKGHLSELLAKESSFQDPKVPETTLIEFSPLLDSADMHPKDWRKIARVIQKNHHAYDGFLIIHGTDTMAYTASALSFMLTPPHKPVILTGSQIPLQELRNDARDNLLNALLVLQGYHDRLCEVFLCFDNTLFRGNRCTKVDSDALNAFASPNFPVVGELGIHLNIHWNRVQKRPESIAENRPLTLAPMGDATVASFRLFPGLCASYLDAMLRPPVQGIVLECYGSGNAPSRNPEFLKALREATQRGVVMVAVTQPTRGSADLRLYSTGQALRDTGVVSGYDMTTEAALAKLFYLFGRGLSPEQTRQELQRDLRGEMTVHAPDFPVSKA